MSCLDEKSLDFTSVTEFKKIITAHSWNLAHCDEFGESGVITRYNCAKCGKEWTSLLLDPEKVTKRRK
ncbi:MAG: hypothetical protein ACYCPP_07005 [Nitrososphaerales archaeon]